MDWVEKQLLLQKKAESDQIYRVYSQDFLASEKPFEEYADGQSEEVRQILWQYAESGRMMQQRLVNLACIHMEFPEEK